MSGSDRDLSGLTAAERATLLRRLWASAGPEERARLFSEVKQDHPDLREALAAAGGQARARKAETAGRRLGRGLGLWRSTPVLVLVLLLSLGFLADFGIGIYQHQEREARAFQELLLRNTAFGRLYSELVRVEQMPDGQSYKLVVTMQNIDPSSPIFVMLLPIRVYVQVGLSWQEVPSRPAEGTRWSVTELYGGQDDAVIFEVDKEDWAELVPGYMHIRIEADMLISTRAEPEDDIIERDNRYYVYLKPHGADDADIQRRMGNDQPPPVYMPMPPH